MCCKDKNNNAAGGEMNSCCKNDKGGCGCGSACACKKGCSGKCYCRCLLGFLFGWMCPKKNKGNESCCKTDEGMKKEGCCKNKNTGHATMSYFGGANGKTGTRNDVVTDAKILLGLLSDQTKGMSNEQMVQQPNGIKNHALWNMGHIAVTLDGVVAMLGGQKTLNADWDKLFGGGSQPVADMKAYPTLEQMQKTLESLSNKAFEMYVNAPSDLLRSANPHAKMMPACPTLGSMVVFLLSGHIGVHVGQISVWRRAMGKDPLF